MKDLLKTKEFWLGTTTGMGIMFTLLAIFTMIFYLTGIIQ